MPRTDTPLKASPKEIQSCIDDDKLIDNTVKKDPIACITVDNPYIPDEVYDLIIGNVPVVRLANDPDPTWQEACAVTTRAQSKKEGKSTPLRVRSRRESTVLLWTETL